MHYLFTFIGLLFSLYSYSIKQDTLIFCQKGELMFENSYSFIVNNYESFNSYKALGRFIHLASTDDGQSWYGNGTFVKKGQKIILSYSNINEYYDIHTSTNKTNSDSINFQILIDNEVGFFTGIKQVIAKDTNQYLCDSEGKIEIPKLNKNEQYYLLPTNFKLDFISDSIDNISLNIKCFATNFIHDKTEIVRKRNGKSIIAPAMFVKSKRKEFILVLAKSNQCR